MCNNNPSKITHCKDCEFSLDVNHSAFRSIYMGEDGLDGSDLTCTLRPYKNRFAYVPDDGYCHNGENKRNQAQETGTGGKPLRLSKMLSIASKTLGYCWDCLDINFSEDGSACCIRISGIGEDPEKDAAFCIRPSLCGSQAYITKESFKSEGNINTEAWDASLCRLFPEGAEKRLLSLDMGELQEKAIVSLCEKLKQAIGNTDAISRLIGNLIWAADITCNGETAFQAGTDAQDKCLEKEGKKQAENIKNTMPQETGNDGNRWVPCTSAIRPEDMETVDVLSVNPEMEITQRSATWDAETRAWKDPESTYCTALGRPVIAWRKTSGKYWIPDCAPEEVREAKEKFQKLSLGQIREAFGEGVLPFDIPRLISDELLVELMKIYETNKKEPVKK